jgi:hypothetical protein
MDENPGFEVNRRFLLGKYPNIKGFHPVSCAKVLAQLKFLFYRSE